MGNIAFCERLTLYQDSVFGFTDTKVWLNAVVDDFKNKANYVMNEVQQNVLSSALKYRMAKSYDEDFEGSIFNLVNGIYEVMFIDGTTYIIQISSEPAHILGRTTGRSGYSCEHITNDMWMGPFHDIALMNSTAYFIDKNTGKWMGRLNLRWAKTPEGVTVVGVDPNIYPFHSDYAGRPDILLKEAIYYILEKSGTLNYDIAKTPYLYKGHSDTTTQYPNVALPYKGFTKLMEGITPVKEDEWTYYDDYWDQYRTE